MKKPLIMLGTGACALLAFSSCQSSKTADGGYEEAAFASDTIADGQIPPWLLEDDGETQVDAGGRTPERDKYPIPEPTHTVADTHGGSASSRQNQPELAKNDVSVETPVTDASSSFVTPPPSEPVYKEPQPAKPKARPTAKKPQSSSGKRNKQTGKRYSEPTMLTYKVRPGDNLSDIAKRSRTTVAQIKKDSGLKGDTIYPGQTIKVRYIPKGYKPGKNSGKASSRAKAAKSKTHVVAKGETISGIAKKYGVPYGQILKANGLSASDATRIRPGKRLSIPGGTESSKTGSGKRRR